MKWCAYCKRWIPNSEVMYMFDRDQWAHICETLTTGLEEEEQRRLEIDDEVPSI